MRARQLPLARLRRPRIAAPGAGDAALSGGPNSSGSDGSSRLVSLPSSSASSFFTTTSSVFFLGRAWPPQPQTPSPPCAAAAVPRRQHSTLLPLRTAGRPQLPFLGAAARPAAAAAAAASPRYFTTQRRRWLRYEALAFAKYTLYFWAAVACLVLGQFVVQQEWLERAHPTPPAWTFLSRMRLRGAQSERLGDGDGGDGLVEADGSSSSAGDGGQAVDHVKVIQILLDLLARLEDAQIDGAGVVALADAADATATSGALAPMDIRAKDEPWRRGYFEALLAAAATAEHVDGWVRDRTRNVVCPPDMVVGPSNRGRPRRPLPPGSTLVGGAPREEDCDPDPCFPAPAALYNKLLRTRGLTPRQQITAALAYANYLEYKQDRAAAAAVYGRAVLVAAAATAKTAADGDDAPSFFAPGAVGGAETADAAAWIQAWAKNQGSSQAKTAAVAASTPVSQNLLATLTAYATFQARSGDVATALPLFVALLQARQALPPSSSSSSSSSSGPAPLTPVEEVLGAASAPAAVPSSSSLAGRVRTLFSPPAYPPPPDDGLGPPRPGPQAVCNEAALRLHIGEILYASAQQRAGWLQQQQHAREEGIAWTREAVDVAEEQLHALAQAAEARRKEQKKAQALLGSLLAGGTADAAAGTAAAKTTCRQCLATGLDNWATMVAQLARDEARRKGPSSASSSPASSADAASWWPSWLRLWGGDEAAAHAATSGSAASSPHLHRWAAEEKVIQERRRRARELLEDEQRAPAQGFLGLFTA